MRIVLSVIGALAVLLGAAWVLEGLAVIPAIVPPARLHGSVALTGNGAFLIAAAAMLIVWANRGRRPKG
ncbi:MAG TPA: hypothetical protein VKU90_14895 [Caulobacteraceae bacterium]|jgi:hypothetical protein|nr:hypothetical protein [Caulobacteraceae bacterium]